MTHRVLFHPLAAEDLDGIDTYIAQDSPTNAIAFVRRIRTQCERLADPADKLNRLASSRARRFL